MWKDNIKNNLLLLFKWLSGEWAGCWIADSPKAKDGVRLAAELYTTCGHPVYSC